MKFSILLLAVFIPQTWAAPRPDLVKAVLEAQPSCSNFVRFDDANIYLGFGAYKELAAEPRRPVAGQLRVAPLDGSGPFELATDDAVIDVVTDRKTAFVLTYSGLEEWNLETRTRVALYPTTSVAGPLADRQHASAMARFEDKLVIAHGRLGVSFFDLKARSLGKQVRLLQEQGPLESMATGVTVQGNLAYVVMDGLNPALPGDGARVFRGLVVFNLGDESIRDLMRGLEMGATAVISDSRSVLVSFGGLPIYRYNRESLVGMHVPEPEKRLWHNPLRGHPIGAPALDEKYYYTCFAKAPAYAGEHHGYFHKVPVALDRKALGL